jgi:hypothetical protein
MWAYACGIHTGDLVRHHGLTHWATGLEHVDQDYGSIGTATGYLLGVPATGGRPVRVWLGAVTRVRELAAAPR